jgi:acyl carrier protein
VVDRLHQIIVEHGRVRLPAEALDDDTDLFAAGMDSMAVMNVLLSIEDAFGVEFPDALLNRSSFATLGRLRGIVSGLQPQLV